MNYPAQMNHLALLQKRARVQKVSAMKIAELEVRIARLEKQASIINRLKEILFRMPKRFIKNVATDVLFFLSRLFIRHKGLIQNLTKSSLETMVLHQNPLVDLNQGKSYWTIKEFNTKNPELSKIESPVYGWITIEAILLGHPEFTNIFTSRKNSDVYRKAFINVYDSWVKHFYPLLLASEGKVKEIRVDKEVYKVYEKKAVGMIGHFGFASITIFMHFWRLFGDFFGNIISLLFFYLLLYLPYKIVKKALSSLFSMVYNRDLEEIVENPPTEFMGKPIQ